MTSHPRRGQFRLPSLEQRRGILTFKNKHRLFPKSMQASHSGNIHTGFLRARHRLFESQGCTKVLYRSRVGSTLQAPYPFRQLGRMGKGTSHDSPWPFYSHASQLTLVTPETACIPPTRISLACSPFARNLG
jgi:hypothetical protein